MNRLKIWIQAARPKTLVASISPIFIASILSIVDEKFQFTTLVFTLFTALGIQIGTNFANDYFDFLKGADTPLRKGPVRATQAGLVEAIVMRRAFILTFGITLLSGMYLIYQGGLAIALLLLIAIPLGVLYTAGPYPLAYLGLGDVFVFVFFGPIATLGTYYLQTGNLSIDAFLAGLGTGAFSTAILIANNLRDVEEDRAAHKRTTVVRFGRSFGFLEYAMMILTATLVLFVLSLKHPFILLGTLATFPAFLLTYKVYKNQSLSSSFEIFFKKTAELFLIYTLLFSISWML